VELRSSEFPPLGTPATRPGAFAPNPALRSPARGPPYVDYAGCLLAPELRGQPEPLYLAEQDAAGTRSSSLVLERTRRIKRRRPGHALEADTPRSPEHAFSNQAPRSRRALTFQLAGGAQVDSAPCTSQRAPRGASPSLSLAARIRHPTFRSRHEDLKTASPGGGRTPPWLCSPDGARAGRRLPSDFREEPCVWRRGASGRWHSSPCPWDRRSAPVRSPAAARRPRSRRALCLARKDGPKILWRPPPR